MDCRRPRRSSKMKTTPKRRALLAVLLGALASSASGNQVRADIDLSSATVAGPLDLDAPLIQPTSTHQYQQSPHSSIDKTTATEENQRSFDKKVKHADDTTDKHSEAQPIDTTIAPSCAKVSAAPALSDSVSLMTPLEEDVESTNASAAASQAKHASSSPNSAGATDTTAPAKHGGVTPPSGQYSSHVSRPMTPHADTVESESAESKKDVADDGLTVAEAWVHDKVSSVFVWFRAVLQLGRSIPKRLASLVKIIKAYMHRQQQVVMEKVMSLGRGVFATLEQLVGNTEGFLCYVLLGLFVLVHKWWNNPTLTPEQRRERHLCGTFNAIVIMLMLALSSKLKEESTQFFFFHINGHVTAFSFSFGIAGMITPWLTQGGQWIDGAPFQLCFYFGLWAINKTHLQADMSAITAARQILTYLGLLDSVIRTEAFRLLLQWNALQVRRMARFFTEVFQTSSQWTALHMRRMAWRVKFWARSTAKSAYKAAVYVGLIDEYFCFSILDRYYQKGLAVWALSFATSWLFLRSRPFVQQFMDPEMKVWMDTIPVIKTLVVACSAFNMASLFCAVLFYFFTHRRKRIHFLPKEWLDLAYNTAVITTVLSWLLNLPIPWGMLLMLPTIAVPRLVLDQYASCLPATNSGRFRDMILARWESLSEADHRALDNALYESEPPQQTERRIKLSLVLFVLHAQDCRDMAKAARRKRALAELQARSQF